MRAHVLLATVVGLSAVLTACAEGVVDAPRSGGGDDDDDDGSGVWSEQQGSDGSCYVGLGECNPVGDDCPAGYACDAAQSFQYVCFPPPNEAPLGGSCDVSYGPFCEPGATCVEGVCHQYCCAAGDCVSGGSCEPVLDQDGFIMRVCAP